MKKRHGHCIALGSITLAHTCDPLSASVLKILVTPPLRLLLISLWYNDSRSLAHYLYSKLKSRISCDVAITEGDFTHPIVRIYRLKKVLYFLAASIFVWLKILCFFLVMYFSFCTKDSVPCWQRLQYKVSELNFQRFIACSLILASECLVFSW